jgi:hypothetical protein
LELLCVGAAIGGKIKPEAGITDIIDGAFSAWQQECASRTNEMRSIYDGLLGGRDKLTEIARARVSSMKGGQVGAMLAPSRVVTVIRNIRRSKWRLGLIPPDSDRGELANLYRQTKSVLEGAAAAEMSDRQRWLGEMESAFGSGATRSMIVTALAEAQRVALEAGIGSNNTSKALSDALERFRNVNFDDSLSAARNLANYQDGLTALPHFGRGRRNGVEAGTALAKATEAFLDAVDQNLEVNGQSHDAKYGALANSMVTINSALEAIEADFLQLSTPSQETVDAA